MRFLFLSLILFTSLAHAAEPVIVEKSIQELPDVFAQIYTIVQFKFDFNPKTGWEDTDKVVTLTNRWTTPDALDIISFPDGQYYCTGPAGQYNITGEQTYINWTKQDIDIRSYSVTINILGDTPPKPPTPPEPPEPAVDNPFPNDGKFRVLIIEEKDQREDIPIEQQNIFSSKEVIDYLDQHCAAGPQNYAEWRIFDQNTTVNGDTQWKKAMAVKRTSPFWIVISNGTNWTSQELPKSVEDMMTLLKKWGG